MTNWINLPIDEPGSEQGRIIHDQELPPGARITLEEECQFAPFAITCGIYGWMVHTRFFSDRRTAEEAFEQMKRELEVLLDSIPLISDQEFDLKMKAVQQDLEAFIERNPWSPPTPHRT